MPEPFAHLHLHSHYSLLDSTIRPKALMRQIASLGMGEVALTDHGNLFGAYEFYSAAKAAGLRAVLGCEVYVAPGNRTDKTPAPHGGKPYTHLVLLAENQKGWRNLMELVTTAYLEGFYHRPRIDRELLSRHAEGLIGLSACLSGEISQRILDDDLKGATHSAEEMREILGRDNFFLEIQDHGLAHEQTNREGMQALAEASGIPIVATNDCHFHERADVDAHRVLIGIGQNKTLSELRSDYAYNDEFYVKSPAEMEQLFGPWPGALARTVEIARRCHVSFPADEFHLPRFPVPDSRPPATYLEELAQQGLVSRLGDRRRRRHSESEYWARLEFELGVIGSMGFQGYFLIVWDFIRYAREHAIPVGPGRGSAAGSLVAYALRITDIDPLEYDLLFERFLNPDRISMPDIDIDFCQRGRDEVIAHVRRLYGEENVSQIATFNVLQARSCIRDVGRVMGMSFSETDRIAKLVPETLGITLDNAVKESPRLAEAIELSPAVKSLFEVGKKLEGLSRHCGVHAAGVVIAPRPVREIVPLYRTSRDEVVTQFDKDVIEKLGLLKMDFLGLKTLTVIDDCLASLRAAGLEAPDFNLTELDDPAVYALFRAGDTDGIFQFESAGMRDLLRLVQPSRFEELAALNALYRPGPMQWTNDFADRKHGRQKISYLFPELEEVLGETYGVIVYQEQVMRIAQRIAGFSMARADTLRKAMGKKQKELIDEQGGHFISGGVANGFPREKVEALWRMIVPFAQYGFNKSHSVAYAYLAYQTAFLKAHFREHFWAAMLSSEIANTEKLAAYVSLLVSTGVRVLGPDINSSQVAFTVEGTAIRVGLGAVKGVGEAASQAVVQTRLQSGQIRSLPQLLRALPERALNRKVVECLVRAGVFDSIHPHRRELLGSLDNLVDQASRQRQAIESGQGFLFGFDDDECPAATAAATPRADRETLLQGERETLGFYLSGHPLDRWERVLRDLRAIKITDLRELAASGAASATVAGLVSGLKVRPIKDGRNQGRRMASFTLEDQTSSVRVVAFADAFEKAERFLTDGGALLVTATLRCQDAEHVELGLEEVVPLEGIEARRAAAVRVEIDLARHGSEAALERLHELILNHEGRVSLRLRLLGDGWRAELVPSRVLGVNPETLIPELNALLGPGHTEVLLG
ncbi:MAG TPA: DNA polymerase III subunit alpha [Thermoanaerobaculaceae bacterium]|nr:DNA polymerase III subunit alpha [Thermoanaerobaculaceae bacterium]